MAARLRRATFRKTPFRACESQRMMINITRSTRAQDAKACLEHASSRPKDVCSSHLIFLPLLLNFGHFVAFNKLHKPHRLLRLQTTYNLGELITQAQHAGHRRFSSSQCCVGSKSALHFFRKLRKKIAKTFRRPTQSREQRRIVVGFYPPPVGTTAKLNLVVPRIGDGGPPLELRVGLRGVGSLK